MTIHQGAYCSPDPRSGFIQLRILALYPRRARSDLRKLLPQRVKLIHFVLLTSLIDSS